MKTWDQWNSQIFQGHFSWTPQRGLAAPHMNSQLQRVNVLMHIPHGKVNPSWKTEVSKSAWIKPCNESAVVKIQNHLIWVIAFSTEILILATLLVVDTSDHHLSFLGCTSVQIHFKYKFRFYIQTMIYHHCHPEFLTSRSGVVPP